MTAPGYSSGGSRPPANAAFRGVVLIVLTVLVGVGLLSQGFANEGGLVDTEPGTGTTQPRPDGDPGAPGTTEPDDDPDDADALPPPRDPSEVIPLVLNGSGVNGAASRVRDALVSLNYTPRSPGNTPERVAETSIYHLEGWRSEALQTAEDLGVDRSLVAPMPAPPPHGAELGAAQILIILGEDRAIAQAGG